MLCFSTWRPCERRWFRWPAREIYRGLGARFRTPVRLQGTPCGVATKMLYSNQQTGCLCTEIPRIKMHELSDQGFGCMASKNAGPRGAGQPLGQRGGDTQRPAQEPRDEALRQLPTTPTTTTQTLDSCPEHEAPSLTLPGKLGSLATTFARTMPFAVEISDGDTFGIPSPIELPSRPGLLNKSIGERARCATGLNQKMGRFHRNRRIGRQEGGEMRHLIDFHSMAE